MCIMGSWDLGRNRWSHGRSLAAVFSSQDSSMLNEIGPSHARTEGQTAALALHPSRKIFPPPGDYKSDASYTVYTDDAGRTTRADRRHLTVLRRRPRRPSMVDADEDDAADFAYKVVNALPPSLPPSPPSLSPHPPLAVGQPVTRVMPLTRKPSPLSPSLPNAKAQDDDRGRPPHR